MDAQFSLCSIQRPLVQVSWLAKLAGWHIYFLNKEFLIHIGKIDIFSSNIIMFIYSLPQEDVVRRGEEYGSGSALMGRGLR